MYQFTEDCMIGIPQIDEEHRQLFQMINEAIALSQEDGDFGFVGKNLLSKLKEYAQTHFAHEEAYMEQISDPELSRQQKEHAAFVEKINSYQDTDWTASGSAQVVNELLTFTAKWLYRHILGSDIMIGKMTQSKEDEDAFAFTDKYKTGIELIDAEHKRLFEIVRETNDVIAAQFLYDKYDEIVDILNELKDYTVMHFQDEERYMESIGYEGLELQRMAHNAFVNRLNEINLDDMDDGTGGQNNQKKDDNLELDSDGYAHWSFPWSLTLNYSVNYSYGEFDKQKMDYRGKFTQNLSFSGRIQPTKGWNFTFSSSYNFDTHKLAYMNCTITRDLHCFSMSASFVPVGPYKSYNFHIAVKSSLLADLKYDKRSSYSNGVDWY